MKTSGPGLCIILLVLFTVPTRSQTNTYVLNGTATQDNCNCYTLTTATNFANGSVWNATKIDLTNPFDFSFNVYLGCKDGDGADGIVFILQTVANSIGVAGGGMGFQGVSPSIGIALDTWQNIDGNDPSFDHISIQLNGNTTHGTDLAGPVVASLNGNNIEDCQWHVLRITWDPATKIIGTYFDGAFRLSATIDLVNNVFSNQPAVYWGFSSATGGSNNLQKFCTALNPAFTTNFPNNSTCITDNIFSFNDQSVSFASVSGYYWSFGDGTFSTDAVPPPHTYTTPGVYEIKLAITGLDGCRSDTLKKTVAVGDIPVAWFNVFDTCTGKIPRIIDASQVQVGNITKWNWLLDGVPVSTSQHPQIPDLTSGTYTIQLQVTSQYGCTTFSDPKQFVMKLTPIITGEADGSCVNMPVTLTGNQLNNAPFVADWTWTFGNTPPASGMVVNHVFNQPGDYTVQLVATEANGCKSDPAIVPVKIIAAVANAGRDTVIIKNQPFQLNGTGADGGTYTWSPPTGLNNTGVRNPLTILQDDQSYMLTVTTPDGCMDDDMINIIVFKGSDIYIPTGFTPNNDGLNETLIPRYRGIKTLHNYSVYNRWGQVVFMTTDQGKGWDGSINGVRQNTGVFVWVIKAVDYVGKVYDLRGTTTLIR